MNNLISNNEVRCDCCISNDFRPNPFKAGLCGDCQHPQVTHGPGLPKAQCSVGNVCDRFSSFQLDSICPSDTTVPDVTAQHKTQDATNPLVSGVGIKLGNYNTMAALYKPKTTSQRYDDVEMITLNYGENSLSTTVSFDSTGALFGQPFTNNPVNSVLYGFLALLGKGFNDVAVRNFLVNNSSLNSFDLVDIGTECTYEFTGTEEGKRKVMHKNPQELTHLFLCHLKQKLKNIAITPISKLLLLYRCHFPNHNDIFY
ncbi:hypothetical protein GEMRC1_007910 [Eukaryota sp. GEM-RC1]